MNIMKKFINGFSDYKEWRQQKEDNKNTIRKMEIVGRYLPRIQKGDTLTLDEEMELLSCVELSVLDGKLDGFHSISTSVLMNPFCQCRARNDEMVCSKCYAANSANKYSGLAQRIEINYIILNAYVFSDKAWSHYNFNFEWSIKAGRIESHGDVASVTCARNYIRLVRTHDFLTFAAYSKNNGIYHNAFKIDGKPGNMIYISSSPYLNKIMDIPAGMMKYVDHTFTVYTLKYAMENGIKINCGGRSCKGCMRCYDLKRKNEFHIAELEKGDAKKAKKVGFDIG